jgi:hypothetical protein
VTATPEPRSATVAWNAPAAAPGAAVTGYRIEDEDRGIVVTVSADVRRARIGSLDNGTAYRFTVTAIGPVGAGQASESSNRVVPADRPGVPGAVRAAARNNAARITWRPAAAHGAAVSSYLITAYPGQKTMTVGGSALSAIVKGLRPGREYRFAVRALNRVGAGPLSDRTRSVRPY